MSVDCHLTKIDAYIFFYNSCEFQALNFHLFNKRVSDYLIFRYFKRFSWPMEVCFQSRDSLKSEIGCSGPQF
jgi:hypothetical protein